MAARAMMFVVIGCFLVEGFGRRGSGFRVRFDTVGFRRSRDAFAIFCDREHRTKLRHAFAPDKFQIIGLAGHDDLRIALTGAGNGQFAAATVLRVGLDAGPAGGAGAHGPQIESGRADAISRAHSAAVANDAIVGLAYRGVGHWRVGCRGVGRRGAGRRRRIGKAASAGRIEMRVGRTAALAGEVPCSAWTGTGFG
jgi:hypothetical protein